MKKLLLLFYAFCLLSCNKVEPLILYTDKSVTLRDCTVIESRLINKIEHYSANYNCITSKTFSKYNVDSILKVAIFTDGLADTVFFYNVDFPEKKMYYAKSIYNFSDSEKEKTFKTIHYGDPSSYINEINKAYGKYNFGDKLEGDISSAYERNFIGTKEYNIHVSSDKHTGIYEVRIYSDANDGLIGLKENELRNIFEVIYEKYSKPTVVHYTSEYELDDNYIHWLYEWDLYGFKTIKIGLFKNTDYTYEVLCEIANTELIKEKNRYYSELIKSAQKIIKEERRKSSDNF